MYITNNSEHPLSERSVSAWRVLQPSHLFTTPCARTRSFPMEFMEPSSSTYESCKFLHRVSKPQGERFRTTYVYSISISSRWAEINGCIFEHQEEVRHPSSWSWRRWFGSSVPQVWESEDCNNGRGTGRNSQSCKITFKSTSRHVSYGKMSRQIRKLRETFKIYSVL